jgi:ubiquinone/menaquinone biosynthesis C-methylase UbiE
MEAGLKPGNSVLEFGCGPGSYTVIAAGMVGTAGRIYALDIHPLALKSVGKRAAKRGLTNIETILSDGATGLEDSSIDVVLLYDVFHDLDDPNSVLQELHRVLKPVGSISFSDHHMKEPDITSKVTVSGLFKLAHTGKITYTFTKTGS